MLRSVITIGRNINGLIPYNLSVIIVSEPKSEVEDALSAKLNESVSHGWDLLAAGITQL
jgi:hypothetical protein